MVGYGMVWCGRIWYGRVWYGMVGYGMVLYGVVRFGVLCPRWQSSAALSGNGPLDMGVARSNLDGIAYF